MSEDTEEDARDAQCGTNIRAFEDFKAWKNAVKPWSEFFRLSRFKLPRCIDGYVKRLKRNLSYFLANYAVVTVILVFCGIITSFWLLISTIILGIIVYIIYAKTKNGPIRVGSEEIPTWILYSFAVFITLPLFIFTNVGYILYCAVGVGIVLIMLHSSFYSIEPSHIPVENIEVLSEMNDTPRIGTVEITHKTDTQPRTKVRFDDDQQ